MIFKIVAFIHLMIFSLPAFSLGHGSSGGGQSRAEHFKAIGHDIVRLQSNYLALQKIRFPNSNHRYLDDVSPSELAGLLKSVNVEFLGTANKNISKRFVWINQKLMDLETGQNDLDAIYLADKKFIYVATPKWDVFDELEKYLIVRKEYWRGLSKPNAHEMRAYIILHFKNITEAPNTEQKPEILAKNIRCVGPNGHFLTVKTLKDNTYELSLHFRDPVKRHFKLLFPKNKCFWRKHRRRPQESSKNYFFAEIKCYTGSEFQDQQYQFHTELTQRIQDVVPQNHGAWSYTQRKLQAHLSIENHPEFEGRKLFQTGKFSICSWHKDREPFPWEHQKSRTR